MRFNVKYDIHSCPPICFKSFHHRYIYILTLLYLVTCSSFVWYINMVFILRTQRIEKSLLDISRFNLSTDFDCVLKIHFGELKMRFIPTAPFHKDCYIHKFFDCLEVSKCVLLEIWNIFVYLLLDKKAITTLISINLL
jgi:hypothetical protein